ncbi:hypothetical protein LTR27_005517 [Elasticomyces elasticus]|nr:hypothetical protein LTR27_005517 [Elasticomyces elasticus]
MVQYQRGEGPYPGLPESARDYWKLRCNSHLTIAGINNFLAGRNFGYNKSSGKLRLLALLSRSECGLRSYERNSKGELRQICQERNLALETSQSANKADLIALLEAFDDSADFPRFLELLPELRLQIYTHHFEDFKEGSIIVALPITAACRLIREEARPLFYSTHRFDIDINFRDWSSNLLKTSFVELLPASAFALIRKLRLLGRFPGSIYSMVAYTTMECELDLGGEYTEARVKKMTGRRMWTVLTAAEMGDANLRISKVLSDMSTRSMGKALRGGDISALCDALL